MFSSMWRSSWFFYFLAMFFVIGGVNFPYWESIYEGHVAIDFTLSREPAEGVLYYEILTVKNPHDPYNYLKLSRAYYDFGNTAAAFHAYRQAVLLDPHIGPADWKGFIVYMNGGLDHLAHSSVSKKRKGVDIK